MGFTKYLIAKTDKFVGNGIIGRNALQKRKLEAGLTNDCSIQPAFTFSKITIKTPENVIEVIQVSLLMVLNRFYRFSGISIIALNKQMPAGLVEKRKIKPGEQ